MRQELTALRDRQETAQEQPVVSVCCTTYQQVDFIKTAIEGFLMQKTNFPVEILIRDDASKDGTAEIVREYADAHKTVIRPILNKENLFSKGVAPMRDLMSKATGKYIALCEGDDYWSDPLKLQKQVDFMKKNPDCSLCYHITRVKLADHSLEDYLLGAENVQAPTKFTLQEFIRTNNAMGIRTVAMLFKTEALKGVADWYYKAPLGDLILQLHLGTQGKYGYLPEEMAIYNRGNPGAWSANNHSVEWRMRQIEQHNKTHILFDKSTNGKYHSLIKKRNNEWVLSRIKYIQKHFDRSAQFKIMKKYFGLILPRNKTNLLIWLQFILGDKGMARLIAVKHRIF